MAQSLDGLAADGVAAGVGSLLLGTGLGAGGLLLRGNGNLLAGVIVANHRGVAADGALDIVAQIVALGGNLVAMGLQSLLTADGALQDVVHIVAALLKSLNGLGGALVAGLDIDGQSQNAISQGGIGHVVLVVVGQPGSLQSGLVGAFVLSVVVRLDGVAAGVGLAVPVNRNGGIDVDYQILEFLTAVNFISKRRHGHCRDQHECNQHQTDQLFAKCLHNVSS